MRAKEDERRSADELRSSNPGQVPGFFCGAYIAFRTFVGIRPKSGGGGLPGG